MIKEKDARKQVKSLKRFYMDGVTFAIVNMTLILVWVVMDRSTTFWPKYVIVTWGMLLIFKAYRMGILPLFSHRLSFLTAEWEEKKIKELIENHHEQRRIHLNRERKSAND